MELIQPICWTEYIDFLKLLFMDIAPIVPSTESIGCVFCILPQCIILMIFYLTLDVKQILDDRGFIRLNFYN